MIMLLQPFSPIAIQSSIDRCAAIGLKVGDIKSL